MQVFLSEAMHSGLQKKKGKKKKQKLFGHNDSFLQHHFLLIVGKVLTKGCTPTPVEKEERKKKKRIVGKPTLRLASPRHPNKPLIKSVVVK